MVQKNQLRWISLEVSINMSPSLLINFCLVCLSIMKLRANSFTMHPVIMSIQSIGKIWNNTQFLPLVQQEQELPRLIRGQVHRCVGNYDPSRDVLVCVSVRAGLPSELRNAQEAVKVSDAAMRALVKTLSEVWEHVKCKCHSSFQWVWESWEQDAM